MYQSIRVPGERTSCQAAASESGHGIGQPWSMKNPIHQMRPDR